MIRPSASGEPEARKKSRAIGSPGFFVILLPYQRA